MYLPSGEIAARKALPVVVNLVSFTVSKGGREFRRQTTAAAITNIASTARAAQRAKFGTKVWTRCWLNEVMPAV